MELVLLIVALGIIAPLIIWRVLGPVGSGASAEGYVPPEQSGPPELRYIPWTPEAPVAPTPLTDPSDWTPSPEIEGLRAFDRVADDSVLLDLSPDGREAMILHDETSVTIYDTASGAALKTWRNICPPNWLEHLGADSCFSCAARRLFLGWECSGGIVNAWENVLIDLEKREVTRLFEVADSENSLQIACMSADGRFVAGLSSYSDYHPAFELNSPAHATAEKPTNGTSGEFRLTPGGIWPSMDISRDGRWFAFDSFDGDVQVWGLGDEPADRTAVEPWDWPSYYEHMTVIGNDSPDLMVFDDTGAYLLIIENDAGLIIADLAASDFRLLKPFPDPAETDAKLVCSSVTWLNGRRQAIFSFLKPEPKFVLVDLDDGAILREWPATHATVIDACVSNTGEFALLNGEDGALRVLPLLSDAA